MAPERQSWPLEPSKDAGRLRTPPSSPDRASPERQPWSLVPFKNTGRPRTPPSSPERFPWRRTENKPSSPIPFGWKSNRDERYVPSPRRPRIRERRWFECDEDQQDCGPSLWECDQVTEHHGSSMWECYDNKENRGLWFPKPKPRKLEDDIINQFCDRLQLAMKNKFGVMAIQTAIQMSPEYGAMMHIKGDQQILQVIYDQPRNHYVLLEWCPDAKRVYVFDSLLSTFDKQCRSTLNDFVKFQILSLFAHLYEEDGRIPITIVRDYDQQADGWSCGYRATAALLLRAYEKNVSEHKINLLNAQKLVEKIENNDRPSLEEFEEYEITDPRTPSGAEGLNCHLLANGQIDYEQVKLNEDMDTEEDDVSTISAFFEEGENAWINRCKKIKREDPEDPVEQRTVYETQEESPTISSFFEEGENAWIDRCRINREDPEDPEDPEQCSSTVDEEISEPHIIAIDDVEQPPMSSCETAELSTSSEEDSFERIEPEEGEKSEELANEEELDDFVAL